MEPSLDLQVCIRQRLLASEELLSLVQPDHILDASGRPELMPCVLIGEAQTLYQRFTCVSHATLHIWFAEPGMAQAKSAVSAIVAALRFDGQINGGVLTLDNFVVHDLSITQTRFMRDPHGPYSHAIVSVAAVMKEK